MLIDDILTFCGYFITFLLLVGEGKIVFGLFNRKININSELVDKDNTAFIISYAGYFAGLVITIAGVFMGPSAGFYEDIIDIVIYGNLGIVLLFLASIVNDKIILRKFSIYKEIIEDRSPATGVVLAASYISSGIVLMGAISGEGGNFLTAIIYWIVGQIALILFTLMYEKLAGFDVHKEIERDNTAAGVAFAGILVAVSLLVNEALTGDFQSWVITAEKIGADLVLGAVFLPLTRFALEKILLKKRTFAEEISQQSIPNIGLGILEAVSYILCAAIVISCI